MLTRRPRPQEWLGYDKGNAPASPASVARLQKVMLVCSEDCNEVEKCLQVAGCSVTQVKSGGAAVAQADREYFDAAVLVSTGSNMDLAETVFNLRDINRSMRIIILASRDDIARGAVVIKAVAEAMPKTRWLTVAELENYVRSIRRSEEQEKSARVEKP
ncbi:MAG: hypothetical protein A3F90_09295 [Deltaproteobacteria bacterium RIFCSPLOWO2_12_FULL_60_19]|nr:MAG: hypothetical protein A3F90_09295 [Deltaproteobacteria bacterium RIFCSPLOWO2_12_FULL_60_19]